VQDRVRGLEEYAGAVLAVDDDTLDPDVPEPAEEVRVVSVARDEDHTHVLMMAAVNEGRSNTKQRSHSMLW
jgi:hypothetical protein